MPKVTMTLTHSSPLKAEYRDSANLSFQVQVGGSINPLRRESLQYNHVKKNVTVRDIVKVPGSCNTKCVTSPVVLEIRFSAPEGIDATAYYNAAIEAIKVHGGIGTPIVSTNAALAFDKP